MDIPQHHDSITESISSILNPNPDPILQPTFFHPSSPSYLPHPNSTPPNLFVYDPPFTSFTTTQNDDVYFNNSQPPASSNANVIQDSGHNLAGVSIKNLKKRTRASRRPPTTVLTTDTANFRQMVQEFTGIPTPPFSAPFSRRLDVYGGGGRGPLYPIIPAPQKIEPVNKGLETVTSSRDDGKQV
ncbi:hypothetical protein SSX86_007346 [Deinandra increscens subsp. villosa]|uniref:VQ domain-containing protein n=1 Tax=Deinandra increscens subsp. villosa TaxID=3103831 RepID=A0AAP0DDR1_9ASTR